MKNWLSPIGLHIRILCLFLDHNESETDTTGCNRGAKEVTIIRFLTKRIALSQKWLELRRCDQVTNVLNLKCLIFNEGESREFHIRGFFFSITTKLCFTCTYVTRLFMYCDLLTNIHTDNNSSQVLSVFNTFGFLQTSFPAESLHSYINIANIKKSDFKGTSKTG